MAKIVTITNPLTGQPAQVDQLDHTAQQIDDGLNIARGVSNPNLLDNWYFGNPVNQRGQVTYGHTPVYSIDRWSINNDYAFVDINNGHITIRGNDINGYGGIIQKLEDSVKTALLGKTVTLSVLMKPYTALELAGKEVCEGADSAFGLYSFTFTGTTNNYVIINAKIPVTPGEPIADIIAVKLELGSQQTLAHQDENGVWVLNEIPNFGEQLRRCQRYFVNFNPYRVAWFAMPPAVANNASQAYSAVSLPVAMRTQPTVTYGGNIVLSQASDNTVTGIIVSNSTFTGNSIQLRYDVGAGGLTANSLYRVQGHQDSTAYIHLSADL